MDIQIPDRKLKRIFEDDKQRRRHFGDEMAKKIHLRMAALRAAESLADFWPPFTGPERCHELSENLAGIFSMDLKHPYRLLFVPLDALPTDGKERWEAIKSIEIRGVENTHG